MKKSGRKATKKQKPSRVAVSSSRLTGLQKRYVDILHSMSKPNKGMAYKLAGSTMTNAKNRSCEAQKVLKKPHVEVYYNSLRQKATEQAQRTADEIIEELEGIGFGKNKARDRIRALDLLAKRLGIFKEDNEQKATKAVVIINFGDLKK